MSWLCKRKQVLYSCRKHTNNVRLSGNTDGLTSCPCSHQNSPRLHCGDVAPLWAQVRHAGPSPLCTLTHRISHIQRQSNVRAPPHSPLLTPASTGRGRDSHFLLGRDTRLLRAWNTAISFRHNHNTKWHYARTIGGFWLRQFIFLSPILEQTSCKLSAVI